MKRKINLRICFLITYLIAFVLLVYKNQTINFTKVTIMQYKEKYYLILTLGSIIAALGQYLIQYLITKWFLRHQKEVNYQAISTSILLSETMIYLISLFALEFNTSLKIILPYTNMVIGLIIYYMLLRKEINTKSIKICFLIKAGFYLSNILLLINS